jgi:arylsulfatase A-like enzyme
MTVDPVLKIIVKPTPTIAEMDKEKDWTEYDLCQTIQELQTKMDARDDQTLPLFVYTQSQNIHLTQRTTEFRKNPPDENNLEYPGFDSYCTTKMKAMDACFGEFINYLKSRNLYEDSIIVLTSDHGDFLGEGGRWGHSYYIYPELIRVPLIIHVPPKLLAGMVWDTNNVAFSADITPSLYYLLGHRPIVNNRIFGRPLFTATQEEQTAYLREDYLIGSSYGVVYGILSKNGRTLFISEPSNGKDSLYNIVDDPRCERDQITGSLKAKYRELIHDYVSEINSFYHFAILQ